MSKKRLESQNLKYSKTSIIVSIIGVLITVSGLLAPLFKESLDVVNYMFWVSLGILTIAAIVLYFSYRITNREKKISDHLREENYEKDKKIADHDKTISKLRTSLSQMNQNISNLEEEKKVLNDNFQMSNINAKEIEKLTGEILKIQYKLYHGILDGVCRDLSILQGKKAKSLVQRLKHDKIKSDYKTNCVRIVKYIESIVESLTLHDCKIALIRNTGNEEHHENTLNLEIVILSDDAYEERNHFQTLKFSSDQCEAIENLVLNKGKTHYVIHDIIQTEIDQKRTFKNTYNENWKDHYNTVLTFPIFNKKKQDKYAEGFLWIDSKTSNIFDQRIIDTLFPIAKLCSAMLYSINQYKLKVGERIGEQ
jgi:hypothetical protein